MKKTGIKGFVVLILLLALSSCNKAKQPEAGQINNNAKQEQAQKTEQILGTIISGNIYGVNSEAALEAAFARAKQIEEIMSVKLADSEITKVNEQAFQKEIVVSEDLYYVIEKALYYAELTNGALDPTIGKLIDLWGIGTEKEHIPEERELEEYKQQRNYKNILLDSDKKSVRFLKENIKLDLGAIAKGYVADEMKELLTKEYKIESGMLNLGGNVITIGRKHTGEQWKIGIVNPLHTQEVIASLQIEGKSVVTSGNYERFFLQEGVRYHHILDPNTGYPARKGFISTSIITASSIDADALSTATYILGKEKAMELIESLEGYEGVFVEDNGEVAYTSGLKEENLQLLP